MALDSLTGVLRWQTTALDGPSTNRIRLTVSDGSLLAERSFSVVVRNTQGDFQVALGDTYIETGSSGSVPVQVMSTLVTPSCTFAAHDSGPESSCPAPLNCCSPC